MQIELKRFTSREREWDTIGGLFIMSALAAFTLEDRHQSSKVARQTRIPAGKYPLTLRTVGSHHQSYLAKYGGDFHKGMLQLVGVPNFTDILIHVGNNRQDTDGCILVANAVDFNEAAPSALMKSVMAYERVYPIIRDAILREPTYIDVDDGPVV